MQLKHLTAKYRKTWCGDTHLCYILSSVRALPKTASHIYNSHLCFNLSSILKKGVFNIFAYLLHFAVQLKNNLLTK